MKNQEVEEIKGHFDKVAQELRTDLQREIGGHFDKVAQELRGEIAEVRHYTGAVAEDLRSEIRAVAEGVALANQRIDDVDLRVDGLTNEVRRGFAGVRAEIHRLHETEDELRRRIESQEERGV